MSSTKQRLVEELHLRGLTNMAERANLGNYDDIESNHPTPKILLVAELEECQFFDLADRVKEGEFDNTRQEWQRVIANGGILNDGEFLL